MLMQQYTDNYGVEIEREQAKKFFLKTLFSSPKWAGNDDEPAKLLFSKMFPNIFKVVESTKIMYKNHLACLLQSMEAQIILHRVVPRIARERPNLFIATIHDSIVTTTGNQDYVQKVLLEECLVATGFVPKLEIEHWVVKEKDLQLSKAA
jgi:hypothetical protein